MYVLYADGEILKVRFAGQFGMEANPVIITVILGTLSRDPFSSCRLTQLTTYTFFSAFSFLQGNPAVCFDDDFQCRTACLEILPSV